VWKRSGKALIEKKKRESGSKLRLRGRYATNSRLWRRRDIHRGELKWSFYRGLEANGGNWGRMKARLQNCANEVNAWGSNKSLIMTVDICMRAKIYGGCPTMSAGTRQILQINSTDTQQVPPKKDAEPVDFAAARSTYK
jgi:hypothetical protein